jgi:hypothetical protein
VLRIRDEFFLSRIPDPKTAAKEKDEKKLAFLPFFSHKYHKIKNYFLFEQANEKLWANLQRIRELFTQKIVIKHSNPYEFGIRDLWNMEYFYTGSEVRDPEKN